MHIIIAPNAYKHSLDASRAAKAIERGLQTGYPSCSTECIPVGDGGDGTGKLLGKALNGEEITTTVQDPLGRTISASYGIVNGHTAIIEMAAASGIGLLKQEEYAPMRAGSFGTGQQIVDALNKGVRKIMLCVGGSATVDGGCGILKALGTKFLDEAGETIDPFPENLLRLNSIDLSSLHNDIKNCELVILCDVSNPLLGEKGAATVFAPQKGASPRQVTALEKGLQQLAHVIAKTTGRQTAHMQQGGAAGGVVAGLCGLLGAKAVNGIDYFLDEILFDRSLERASYVITGEGNIDGQTLDGKAPYGVALRARKKNIPVIGFAGRTDADAKPQLAEFFQQLVVISEHESDLQRALANTEMNLEAKAREWIKTMVKH